MDVWLNIDTNILLPFAQHTTAFMRSTRSVFSEHQLLGLHCQTTEKCIMLNEDVRKGEDRQMRRKADKRKGRKTGIVLQMSFMDYF